MEKIKNSDYVAWLKKGNVIGIRETFSKVYGKDDIDKLYIPETFFDECLELLKTRGMELEPLDGVEFKVI